MNATERADLRNRVARAQIAASQPGSVEMDAEVRKMYAWANEVLDRYAPKGRVGKCVYCGYPAPTQRFPRTCHGHSDLPGYDPAFQAELQLGGAA